MNDIIEKQNEEIVVNEAAEERSVVFEEALEAIIQ